MFKNGACQAPIEFENSLPNLKMVSPLFELTNEYVGMCSHNRQINRWIDKQIDRQMDRLIVMSIDVQMNKLKLDKF